MYIAMNRFRVATGAEAEFERIWTERETHLGAVPGFIEFHLLRGPAAEDHTLYASHTCWQSRDAFEAWAKSDAFRQAQRGKTWGKTAKSLPRTAAIRGLRSHSGSKTGLIHDPGLEGTIQGKGRNLDIELGALGAYHFIGSRHDARRRL